MNLKVAPSGLAFDLDVGVEGKCGEGFRIKPHFRICTTRCLEVPFIETEKIGRGTDLWGEPSSPVVWI